MKNKILNLLKSSKDFVSGQHLSNELGISRAAIWKYINALKEEGYEIESISRRGYKLNTYADVLTYNEVSPYLKTNYIGRKWIHFNTIGSTNSEGKSIGDSIDTIDGTVLISEEQTSGRGRLGRQWSSPKSASISMSMVLKPSVDPMQISKITQVAAAAVSLACEEMNIDAYIKWPNDIIINGKKICGILTEMSAELNKVNYVVIGLGFNVNTNPEDFNDDIKAIATSLKTEYNKTFNRKELTARILNNFEVLYDDFKTDTTAKKALKICKEKSILIGKNINVIKNGSSTPAKVLDLNDAGELVVEFENGSTEILISGEVSIRGKNSYI